MRPRVPWSALWLALQLTAVWGRLLLVVLLSLGLLLPACDACDPSAFVLDEFAGRCRALSNAVRDAGLAGRLDLPEKADYTRVLLTLWVDFFLDHGVIPPPIYASVASSSWIGSTRRLGRRVDGLARDLDSAASISVLLVESTACPLEFLQNPESLQSVWAVLHDWEQALASPSMLEPGQLVAVANFDFTPADIAAGVASGVASAQEQWLHQVILQPTERLSELFYAYPGLFTRLQLFRENAIGTWQRHQRLVGVGTVAAVELAFLASSLRDMVAEELFFWQELLFAGNGIREMP